MLYDLIQMIFVSTPSPAFISPHIYVFNTSQNIKAYGDACAFEHFSLTLLLLLLFG
jgi:hypothetical protein